MGSVQSARGAQPGRRRAVRGGAVRRLPSAASAARRRGRPPAPGRHPSVAERRDRPRIGAGRPRAKVPRPRGRALQRPGAGGGPGPLRRHGHGHRPGGLPPPAPSPARGAEGESTPYAAPPVRRAARGPRRTSATHPTRLETRTKESNARASRRESRATPRGAVKAEAGLGGRLRRDLPRGGGAHRRPVLSRSVGQVERERARWDPKDGELCPGRAKPEETLVEARSGPDVQIGRPTWV